MRNLIEYIRKNAIFVALLSVMVVLCVCFGGYMMLQSSTTSAVTPKPEPVEEETKTPTIKSIEGAYGRDGSVLISWSIDRADQELKSVKLYKGDRQLGGEMKDLTRFSMAQSIYQFPSGNCMFTLKATFVDGTELTKDVSVYINQVMGINMTTETMKDGVLLKLTYSYDQDNPVSIPRIKFITGNNIPFDLSYQETTRKKVGSMEQATTTFKITTTNLQPGAYDLTVRWIFDGLNISKDYPVTIEK